MVVKLDGVLHYGPDAIHALSLMSGAAGGFKTASTIGFSAPKSRARMVYPLLRLGRNLLLKALGKTKINQSAGARQRALLAEAGGQRAGCAGVSSPLPGRPRAASADGFRALTANPSRPSRPSVSGVRVQSEILADKQTDMKLSYASTATELLQECV